MIVTWNVHVWPVPMVTLDTGVSFEIGPGSEHRPPDPPLVCSVLGGRWRPNPVEAAASRQLWAGVYDAAGGGDIVHAIAVDSTPDAGLRIFVTGESAIPLGFVTSNVDYATVAYFDPLK